MTRIIIVLILLFSVDALSQQPNSPETGKTNNSSSEEAQDLKHSASDLKPLVDQVASIATNTKPDKDAQGRQEQREIDALDIARDDLVQQENMAKFTRLIYIVTAISVVIGSLGVFLVYKTLTYTKSAAISTKDTLAIAEATLNETRRANKIQLRAYLNPIEIIETRPDESVYIRLCWKNFGVTPAYNVKTFNSFASYEDESAAKEIEIQFPPNLVGATVGPGDKVGASHILENKQKEFIFTQESINIGFGAIEYEDIFGNVYRGEFMKRLIFTQNNKLINWSSATVGPQNKEKTTHESG